VCATLLEPSQGPGELCVRVMSPSRVVPACPFYSLKEVQGYRMLVRGVILVGEREPRGLGRALSGGDVIRTVEAWC
jgi:hypothetical protein